MENEELIAIVENLLLASDEPVTLTRLVETFQAKIEREILEAVLLELQQNYSDRHLQVIEVAGGYQLTTRPEFGEYIRKFLKLDKTTRFSQPALDTLSIIAYKQPLTRTEVEHIRGVDSSGVIRTLLEKKIIGPAGRKKVVGRPMMYRTTQKFLEYFGLKDLSDLPTLEDFKEGELTGDEPTQADFSFEEPVASQEADSAPTGEEVAEEVHEENMINSEESVMNEEEVMGESTPNPEAEVE